MPKAYDRVLLSRLYAGWAVVFAAAFAYCYVNSYLFPAGDLGLKGKIAWTVSRWGAWPLLLPLSLWLYASLEGHGRKLERFIVPIIPILISAPLFSYLVNMLFGMPETLLVSYYRVLPAAAGGIAIFSGIAYRFKGQMDAGSVRQGAVHLSLVPSSMKIETADEKFLKKLYDTIDENLADSAFGVKELAEKTAMSRRQLLRKTGALLDQSPSEILRNRRLEAAKRLLEANADTVSQISYAVGFDSAANFTRLFKQKYGELPSVFRKNCLDRCKDEEIPEGASVAASAK
ncbi:MAG: helix-turn-helix transcriptional regulator [Alphaproteobacteria bacterium]|nr:helix-turn-helix transcriptional regulator [Alphaproteobacteria bacterium]